MERFLWCDNQEIFECETMRDHRQWSPENVVTTLGCTKDKAHDALNEVWNTCRICGRVDTFLFVNEYLHVYVKIQKT